MIPATEQMLYDIMDRLSLEMGLCKSIAANKYGAKFWYFRPHRDTDEAYGVLAKGDDWQKPVIKLVLDACGHACLLTV